MKPIACIVVLGAAAGLCAQAAADEPGFTATAAPLFKQFCFDCHGNDHAEAAVNLERLASDPSFATAFKTWQKVAAMLDARKMPPADVPQPSDAQRRQLLSLVRGALERAAEEQAGDPGEVVVRRLTSAEYAYTLQDLTGLDLDLEQDFVSDAVGGEGFTNVGTAQFVQDSTLERYLDAARKVAAHAVIGAGPLEFFRDPGQTGLELSAINRIQSIYRAHGFRTSAGEGAEPFGLERYPKAFYAAWRYRHRETFGLEHETLASVAAEGELGARFVEHIWSVLADETPSFPMSEIVDRWRALPAPADSDTHRRELEQQIRSECEALYRRLRDWQTRLAGTVTKREQAAVLGDGVLEVTETHSFEADIEWRDEAVAAARIWLSVGPVGTDRDQNPVVIWKQARIRFRLRDRRWGDWQPLKAVLPADNARQLAFGRHPGGRGIAAADFVIAGDASRSFDVPVPEGARGAELAVEVRLDREHGDDCVVRCAISQDERDAEGKTVSALLANPDGAAFQLLKTGARDLAGKLPQVSHREPAPSDRDPIPPPFDNTYNAPERDHFHTKVKYHRDDRFLVEHILDDATRQRLDEAWIDLLASFEYHDVFLRFVADKYRLDLGGRTIAELDDDSIAGLPDEPRQYARHLRDEHESMQRTLTAAEPRHLADVLQFASRAWRRPLSDGEQERLLSFYRGLRSDSQLDHPQALRTLLVRVLVAPDFLYRAERPVGASDVVALSSWELAARLSYFLWSSLPDEELRRAAAAGELADPDQLARQAQRMLRDPKARRFATEFFGQWFGFYQFDRYHGIDPERFPEFNDRLRAALYDEAVSFFEHIVREDRPVTEILFADYAFLNRDLAEHYAIDADVPTGMPSRVDGVERFRRGGLLGLGAVLTATSAPLRTSPVKRGDWILRRVLGTPVPPPPADAGSIPPDDVLSDGRSVRERLEAHRREASCVNCHSRIDPLGFALEHYDPLGRWRDRYRDGQAIDASGTLHDGTAISGPDGLRRYLKAQEPQFRRTLCTKLLAYALGRGELLGDQLLIDEMLAELERDGRFSNLVVRIVTSRQFRYHRGGSRGEDHVDR